jgi:hypothetical protein
MACGYQTNQTYEQYILIISTYLKAAQMLSTCPWTNDFPSLGSLQVEIQSGLSLSSIDIRRSRHQVDARTVLGAASWRSPLYSCDEDVRMETCRPHDFFRSTPFNKDRGEMENRPFCTVLFEPSNCSKSSGWLFPSLFIIPEPALPKREFALLPKAST